MTTTFQSVAGTIQASTRPGMGAIPYKGGTTFRVWGKFATAIHVAGNFNQWSTTANPLSSEENGYWSVDVPGVKEGDQYRYVISSPFYIWDSLAHRPLLQTCTR